MATPYQVGVLAHLQRLIEPVAPVARALDFGSGDGWMAAQLLESGLVREITGVEVLERPDALLTPIVYDGTRLPFEDRSFDLVYAVDVVHHTPSPGHTLRDALRCCGRTFILKDHTYTRRRTKLVISVLDEIGNRRFGVRSRYRYQRGWEWLPVIEGEGFTRDTLIHPLACEPRPVLKQLTDSYQFIARWHRSN